MKAILTNLLTGQKITVTATTEHPDSSYGQAVWVDEEGVAYGQCNLHIPFYEVEIVQG